MQRRILLSSAVVLAGMSVLPKMTGAATRGGLGPFKAQGLASRDGANYNSRFNGNITVTKFEYDGQLKVIGRISGVVQGSGPRKNISNQSFEALATLSDASPNAGGITTQQLTCSILDLDIGAIHLDLLGLVIDIAPIHIDVTAVPGGGLLGELLCALANLLSGINLGNLGNILDLLGDLLETLNEINEFLEGL
jgi:hypothetical protein